MTYLTDRQCPLGIDGQLCQVDTEFWKRKLHCESKSTQESHSGLLGSNPDANKKDLREESDSVSPKVLVTAQTNSSKKDEQGACSVGLLAVDSPSTSHFPRHCALSCPSRWQ